MIVERSMHPDWLSNTYLIGDEPGGRAVLVDSGGPPEPILRAVEEQRLKVTHLLCTHHHYDHVANNDLFRKRFDCPVLCHEQEPGLASRADRTLSHGEELETGGLRVRALHIPGHTAGQLAFILNGTHVFTGDTLFRGSVGGTRAPGHTTFEDLRSSIMDVLMRLPAETKVLPGHTDGSTIGTEWEKNPFVRAWRGLEAPAADRCLAFDRPALLLLRATDYDGGDKCWVRFDEGHEDAIVPGSRVVDA